MNLQQLKDNWTDTELYHQGVHEYFCDQVKKDEFLNEHRTFVRDKGYGFGEDSFHWFWKLLVDEMPSEFRFLEIGVYKSQSLSLIQPLASVTGRKCERYGISPLDSSGDYSESDYRADIERLHDYFFIPKDYTIYEGLSTDIEIMGRAYETSPYDILYVDGSHTYNDCLSDLENYSPMVRRGGFLVIDDACKDMHQPHGFFQGHESVTNATLDYMSKHENHWEFWGNVVHLRFYRRK